VYQSGTDLAAMSAFCMATMSHVLRMESQMLDQVKSDFLGSISHETRSPLHNVLGNLELLLGTNCDAEQREMLINARLGRALCYIYGMPLTFVIDSAPRSCWRRSTRSYCTHEFKAPPAPGPHAKPSRRPPVSPSQTRTKTKTEVASSR